MFHRFVFIYLFLHVLLSPAFAFGQSSPTSQEVQTLDPVVVSATKTSVPLHQVTSAVEVLTEEDFKRRKIKTVVEALRLTQGVAVLQNGGPGGTANVRIRGGSSNQTLVLIDGAIVNSATLGQFNFAHLTTDNIEKVEIVRGAQSTLWGADAMGGVINITTKRGQGSPKAGAFFEYGSFNTLRESGRVSGSKGPVDFSFVLSRWDTTGISQINDRRGATERDAYRNWQASSRVGVGLPRDGRFDFNFRWRKASINIDTGFGPKDLIGRRNDSEQFIFSGTYRQPLTDWWNHALTLSRSQEAFMDDIKGAERNLPTGEFKVLSPSEIHVDEIRVLANRIESQHDFRLNQYVTLTAGYQFREQMGENVRRTSEKINTRIPERIISSHGWFGQMQLNLFDRFFATAGIRHDSFNTFGEATTYRATGGYLVKETNTKIRSSYATGFRAPTINDLFFPNYGNPNLQPEKSQSFDVGVDQTLFADRMTISGGYFWNRYRDRIIFDPACFCPNNVALAKSQGWESMVNIVMVQDQPWMKRLELKGQYTMTLTRDLMTGSRLPRWPVDQASLSLYYQPVDSLNMILDYRFVGSNGRSATQLVGSFNVVNLAVNYDVSDQFEAYVRVDNLFDEEYEEVLNYGTPGRSVFGGIRANFDLPFGSSMK